MKKVLCIGDSLALPGHLNKYEDTWFYKLKIEFPQFDFISFFKRSLTTNVLVEMGGGTKGIDNMPLGADCLEFYMPDLVIIQLGIVDCAPRLLNNFDKLVLKIVPNKIVSYYISFVKKVRKRKLENTLVSFEKFRSNLNNYLARAKSMDVEVIFISISIPDRRIESKNKQINQNVAKYNEYLFELAKNNSFINVTKPIKRSDYNFDIYEDGYHPNELGHEILFQRLKKLID